MAGGFLQHPSSSPCLPHAPPLHPSQAESKQVGQSIFRRSLLNRLQQEYKDREELRTRSLQAWICYVTFICNIFDYLRVRSGAAAHGCGCRCCRGVPGGAGGPRAPGQGWEGVGWSRRAVAQQWRQSWFSARGTCWGCCCPQASEEAGRGRAQSLSFLVLCPVLEMPSFAAPPCPTLSCFSCSEVPGARGCSRSF